MEKDRLIYLRKRVAREAASLLYTSQESEYKQAKERAARILGINFLPSNFEIADELDKISEEIEGSSRRLLLSKMRKDALIIMEILKDFHPKLVGSVWRGTANRNSDIDIVVFSQGQRAIIDILRKNDLAIKRLEKQSVTKKGQAEVSWHIHLSLPTGNVAEIVIRDLEEKNRLNRCEIYGDMITGIGYSQIRTFFDVDPFKKFLPKRR